MTSTTVAKHAARVRKPNRRPGSVYVLTFKRAAAVFLAAFFIGAVFPPIAAPVAHASAISAGIADTAANARACSDAEWLRHVDRTPLHTDLQLLSQAWHDARRSAAHASPALGHAILRYLFTDRGYGRVVSDCQQVSYGQ